MTNGGSRVALARASRLENQRKESEFNALPLALCLIELLTNSPSCDERFHTDMVIGQDSCVINPAAKC